MKLKEFKQVNPNSTIDEYIIYLKQLGRENVYPIKDVKNLKKK